MNEETLLRFIHKIITTCGDGDQAELALRELEGILVSQGFAQEKLSPIHSALEGLEDSGEMIRDAAFSAPALTPEALQNAVTRAHERRLREEEERRNGRC